MDNINNNAFPQVLPEHPHRGLYILISILVFVAIAGTIVYYQINTQTNTFTNEPVNSNPTSQINIKLTNMSEAMKEANSGQVTLTESELKRIAENMNKSKKK